jgi:hypothetical protein
VGRLSCHPLPISSRQVGDGPSRAQYGVQREVVYTMSSPSPPRDAGNRHCLRSLAVAEGSGKNMLQLREGHYTQSKIYFKGRRA